jgi:hypothetical protein
MSLFDEIIENIKKEYATNSNKIGWRFLVTSKKTFQQNNGIAFITLNPGGKIDREDHPRESSENGCAYLIDDWENKNKPGQSPLQKQIQYLFKEITVTIKENDYEKVINSSLCAYFIPFRSPSMQSLKQKDSCIQLARNIWRKVLSVNQFKVIICIDKETYKNLKKYYKQIYLLLQKTFSWKQDGVRQKPQYWN